MNQRNNPIPNLPPSAVANECWALVLEQYPDGPGWRQNFMMAELLQKRGYDAVLHPRPDHPRDPWMVLIPTTPPGATK